MRPHRLDPPALDEMIAIVLERVLPRRLDQQGANIASRPLSRLQTEILHEKALKIKKDCKVDDFVVVEITPSNFGRIAAQTAKQVIVQRIREAERELLYREFLNRKE